MKNIIVSTVAISILFLAGCESDRISDPSTVTAPSVQKAAPKEYTIPLSHMIPDPGYLGNTEVKVVGEVRYSVSLNPNAHDMQIQVQACVLPLYIDTEWAVRGSSRHLVSLATDGALVEASYKVRDRSDNAVLAFTFHAADGKLTLLKIELVPMVKDGGDTIQSSLSSADGAITLDKKVPTFCEARIEGILPDPSIGFNSLIEVVGSAKYSIGPALVKDKYEARLDVSADLNPFQSPRPGSSLDGRSWMISGVSTDYLLIKADSWTITRRYVVQGRERGLFLEITFFATTDCVKVTGMRFITKARPAMAVTD